jgi:hypothetical protein
VVVSVTYKSMFHLRLENCRTSEISGVNLEMLRQQAEEQQETYGVPGMMTYAYKYTVGELARTLGTAHKFQVSNAPSFKFT